MNLRINQTKSNLAFLLEPLTPKVRKERIIKPHILTEQELKAEEEINGF